MMHGAYNVKLANLHISHKQTARHFVMLSPRRGSL